MKKNISPAGVILTILLIASYAFCVVMNFGMMMDNHHGRIRYCLLSSGLFLIAAFAYALYKRRNKKPLVFGTVFWSLSLVCSLLILLMNTSYNDWMSLTYFLMMLFTPPCFGVAVAFKNYSNTLYFAALIAVPAAELIFHIILLAVRKRVKK